MRGLGCLGVYDVVACCRLVDVPRWGEQWAAGQIKQVWCDWCDLLYVRRLHRRSVPTQAVDELEEIEAIMANKHWRFLRRTSAAHRRPCNHLGVRQ